MKLRGRERRKRRYLLRKRGKDKVIENRLNFLGNQETISRDKRVFIESFGE